MTVQKPDGERVSYDPSRLLGISAYREIERKFAIGDRIQLIAPNRELGVANRDLGTLQQIGEDRRLIVRMDGDQEKTIAFDPHEMRHFDHGYAVTSHSSQGLTSERVLVNMDNVVDKKDGKVCLFIFHVRHQLVETFAASDVQSAPTVIRILLNNFHMVRGRVLTDHFQLIFGGILLVLGGHAHILRGSGEEQRWVRGRCRSLLH